MAVSVLTLVLKCSFVVLVVGAAAVPSQGKKKDIGGKQLRNVIITSFGEMPYEPMESSGYYQSDVIPVNFNDEIQQQTMDVALRTGILVEDPNEKKTAEKENINDEIEETSLEDETISTNAKRQAENNNSKEKTQSIKDEDEFLSPRVRVESRKSKHHGQPQYSPDTFISHPLSYGHEEFPQVRKSQIPYRPYPPPPNSDVNINREYYGDLGEGWNLRDAEKILKGRNYNILVVIPDTLHKPHFRESPPPLYVSGAHQPLFYSYPNFEFSPSFDPYRGSALYSSYVHPDESRRQESEERKIKNKHQESPPKFLEVPYNQQGYFNDDYYSGI